MTDVDELIEHLRLEAEEAREAVLGAQDDAKWWWIRSRSEKRLIGDTVRKEQQWQCSIVSANARGAAKAWALADTRYRAAVRMREAMSR